MSDTQQQSNTLWRRKRISNKIGCTLHLILRRYVVGCVLHTKSCVLQIWQTTFYKLWTTYVPKLEPLSPWNSMAYMFITFLILMESWTHEPRRAYFCASPKKSKRDGFVTRKKMVKGLRLNSNMPSFLKKTNSTLKRNKVKHEILQDFRQLTHKHRKQILWTVATTLLERCSIIYARITWAST